MVYQFLYENKNVEVKVDQKQNHFVVTVEDRCYDVETLYEGETLTFLKINDFSHKIYCAKNMDVWYIHIDGQYHHVEQLSTDSRRKNYRTEHKASARPDVRAPMPGKVLKIMVREGEHVVRQQKLMIIEAMKMEHEIVAPIDGIVKKINYQLDDIVDTGQALFHLEPYNQAENK